MLDFLNTSPQIVLILAQGLLYYFWSVAFLITITFSIIDQAVSHPSSVSNPAYTDARKTRTTLEPSFPAKKPSQVVYIWRA